MSLFLKIYIILCSPPALELLIKHILYALSPFPMPLNCPSYVYICIHNFLFYLYFVYISEFYFSTVLVSFPEKQNHQDIETDVFF